MASKVDKEQVKRWRLILGQHSQDSLAQMVGAGGCELSPEQMPFMTKLPAKAAINAVAGSAAPVLARLHRTSPNGWATSAATSKKMSSPSSKTTPSNAKVSRSFSSSRRCSRTLSRIRNWSAR